MAFKSHSEPFPPIPASPCPLRWHPRPVRTFHAPEHGWAELNWEIYKHLPEHQALATSFESHTNVCTDTSTQPLPFQMGEPKPSLTPTKDGVLPRLLLGLYSLHLAIRKVFSATQEELGLLRGPRAVALMVFGYPNHRQREVRKREEWEVVRHKTPIGSAKRGVHKIADGAFTASKQHGHPKRMPLDLYKPPTPLHALYITHR